MSNQFHHLNHTKNPATINHTSTSSPPNSNNYHLSASRWAPSTDQSHTNPLLTSTLSSRHLNQPQSQPPPHKQQQKPSKQQSLQPSALPHPIPLTCSNLPQCTTSDPHLSASIQPSATASLKTLVPHSSSLHQIEALLNRLKQNTPRALRHPPTMPKLNVPLPVPISTSPSLTLDPLSEPAISQPTSHHFNQPPTPAISELDLALQAEVPCLRDPPQPTIQCPSRPSTPPTPIVSDPSPPRLTVDTLSASNPTVHLLNPSSSTFTTTPSSSLFSPRLDWARLVDDFESSACADELPDLTEWAADCTATALPRSHNGESTFLDIHHHEEGLASESQKHPPERYPKGKKLARKPKSASSEPSSQLSADETSRRLLSDQQKQAISSLLAPDEHRRGPRFETAPMTLDQRRRQSKAEQRPESAAKANRITISPLVTAKPEPTKGKQRKRKGRKSAAATPIEPHITILTKAPLSAPSTSTSGQAQLQAPSQKKPSLFAIFDDPGRDGPFPSTTSRSQSKAPASSSQDIGSSTTSTRSQPSHVDGRQMVWNLATKQTSRPEHTTSELPSSSATLTDIPTESKPDTQLAKHPKSQRSTTNDLSTVQTNRESQSQPKLKTVESKPCRSDVIEPKPELLSATTKAKGSRNELKPKRSAAELKNVESQPSTSDHEPSTSSKPKPDQMSHAQDTAEHRPKLSTTDLKQTEDKGLETDQKSQALNSKRSSAAPKLSKSTIEPMSVETMLPGRATTPVTLDLKRGSGESKAKRTIEPKPSGSDMKATIALRSQTSSAELGSQTELKPRRSRAELQQIERKRSAHDLHVSTSDSKRSSRDSKSSKMVSHDLGSDPRSGSKPSVNQLKPKRSTAEFEHQQANAIQRMLKAGGQTETKGLRIDSKKVVASKSNGTDLTEAPTTSGTTGSKIGESKPDEQKVVKPDENKSRSDQTDETFVNEEKKKAHIEEGISNRIDTRVDTKKVIRSTGPRADVGLGQLFGKLTGNALRRGA